jgi:hypothetical protein
LRRRALLKSLRGRLVEEAEKRRDEDAAQKAAEAAQAEKPALPQIKLDPLLFQDQNNAGDLTRDLQLNPAPIQ